jgi:lipopolysaccharide export system ATP-binding protein
MILRAENLIKTYKGRSVVGISVEVNQGERNRWFGPNGAGKQLPLYDCWLVKPNSGNIYLDDLNITDYPMQNKSTAGVGYLAQGPSVFRKLSIEDNILSVLQLTNFTKEEQIAKMEESNRRVHRTHSY